MRNTFAMCFVAAVAAVFAISFAAIIYTGELAPFFGRGIGLTLMGGTVLALVGAFTLSYRGSILQPQDLPAILLAGGVATMIAQRELSGEILFATVACLISVASLATGIVAVLVSKLRLAVLARYIPYPVLAGFLATTGLLLLLGGMGVAVGESLDATSLARFLEYDALLKWVPVSIAALGIVLATRLFAGHLILPLALLATTLFFYTVIAALGLTMDQARDEGFLLGPFQSGSFLTGLGPQIVGLADWAAIFSQVPVIVTVVVVSLLGTTLNASGLELELGRDLDINSEAGGVGIANTLSALFGGLPGYHLLGETILAHRLGLTGPVAGFSSAAGCLIVLFFGGAVLSVMPTGLFATVIAFLGVDLLYSWLWAERRSLKVRDYAIVVLIPIIAITFSFLMAIAAGLLVAFCLFVITYSKLDIIRSQNSMALRRSCVERPEKQLEALLSAGKHAQIIELSGYLFFASANALRERVLRLLSASEHEIDWLIIDFKHVSGVDVSTWHMLQRLRKDCEMINVCPLFASIDHIASGEKGTVAQSLTADVFDTLDHALEYVEDALLAVYSVETTEHGADFFSEFATGFPLGIFGDAAETVTAVTGDLVIEYGSKTDDIYFLQSGRMVVSVMEKDGTAAIVAKIRAGAVIGEMAYYTGSERSANIIADGAVTLVRIDMSRLTELVNDSPLVAAEFHRLIAGHMARRLSRTTTLLRNVGF
jgi:SulP family sulfate permease